MEENDKETLEEKEEKIRQLRRMLAEDILNRQLGEAHWDTDHE